MRRRRREVYTEAVALPGLDRYSRPERSDEHSGPGARGNRYGGAVEYPVRRLDADDALGLGPEPGYGGLLVDADPPLPDLFDSAAVRSSGSTTPSPGTR